MGLIVLEKGAHAVAVTKHVVDTTLRAKRLSARYVPTLAERDVERDTFVEQLRAGTRVEITSVSFVGVLVALVLESGPSGIELVDNDGLAHFIVKRREGWRLRRYEQVDVRFEIEVLCDEPPASDLEKAQRDYDMILGQAEDDDDLHDQMSSHAFEIAKRATGLPHAAKLSADLDDVKVPRFAAVAIYVEYEVTYVLVDLQAATGAVAVTR
jgi:hypothetical protein